MHERWLRSTACGVPLFAAFRSVHSQCVSNESDGMIRETLPYR